MECGQHEVVAAELREHKDMIRELDRRVRHIEQRDAGDGEKFTTLFNMISRLEATLNRLVTDVDQRLRAVELRPAGNWDRVVWALISAGVAAGVTWIVTKGGTP